MTERAHDGGKKKFLSKASKSLANSVLYENAVSDQFKEITKIAESPS